MVSSEAEKLFRAFAEERKRALPQFIPDGIPITLENKFDDAIYNYLYEYWKTNSGEYDPKDDEIIMTKENSFTKNEKKFEQWLLQQYGMTNKEQREYTVKGNLLSLGEIGLSAWGIASAGATKLVVPGKFLASNADDTAKKALQQDTIEDAVEGTLKKEAVDIAEDLKFIKKEEFLEDSNTIKIGNKITSEFQAPKVYKNFKEQITNGKYIIDAKGMEKHLNGTSGKSQFLYDVDAEKAVLDAASYADKYNLWKPSSGNMADFADKAKVPVINGNVGVTGNGELTNYINIYRTKTGFVHGCPGNPGNY